MNSGSGRNKPVRVDDDIDVYYSTTPHSLPKEERIILDMPRNAFTEILQEMFHTFEAKNHDYSNASEDLLANFRESEKYGVPMVNGVLVRMSDKMCRLQTLVTRHAKVKTEAIEDTLTDLAVYAIIARMAVQDQKAVEDLECL